MLVIARHGSAGDDVTGYRAAIVGLFGPSELSPDGAWYLASSHAYRS